MLRATVMNERSNQRRRLPSSAAGGRACTPSAAVVARSLPHGSPAAVSTFRTRLPLVDTQMIPSSQTSS